MPVTVRNTDILFNDGTTQNTAAGVPAHLAVGSQIVAYHYGTSNLLPGATIAGSSLLRITGGNGYNPNSPSSDSFFIENTWNDGRSTTAQPFNRINGSRFGNVGAYQPSNTTTLTGTWTTLTHVRARFSSYSSYDHSTSINYNAVLVVRIS